MKELPGSFPIGSAPFEGALFLKAAQQIVGAPFDDFPTDIFI